MKVLYSLILVFVFSGCSSMLDRFFTQTKEANPKYTTPGKIVRNAPIIQEESKVKVTKKNINPKMQNEFEMVGYIINVQKDPDYEGLYLYTFTDALKSNKIQFFSKKKIRFSPRRLVRVYIKNNFLVKYENYKSVKTRRTINHYIQAAKEYFIKVD